MIKPAICVAGSLNMDLIVYLGVTAAEAGYAAGAQFESHMGGKSLNVAMGIAALDPSVVLIGRVGRDMFGDQILASLAHSGLTTEYVTVDASAHTGIGHVRVNTEGEYDTAVAPGANGSFSNRDIDSFLETAEPPEIAVLNLEVPLPAVKYAAKKFRSLGTRIVLNVSPLQEGAGSFLDLADIIVLNRNEACSILGIASGTESTEVLAALRRLSAATLVLTLGADGVIAQDQDDVIIALGAEPIQVVNSIGAGDSFLAILVLALAQGHDLAMALRAASEAGRPVCGQAASFLSRESIRPIQNSMGSKLLTTLIDERKGA